MSLMVIDTPSWRVLLRAQVRTGVASPMEYVRRKPRHCKNGRHPHDPAETLHHHFPIVQPGESVKDRQARNSHLTTGRHCENAVSRNGTRLSVFFPSRIVTSLPLLHRHRRPRLQVELSSILKQQAKEAWGVNPRPSLFLSLARYCFRCGA